MRILDRIICLISVILLVFLLACGKSESKQFDEIFQSASFRDIPGVTDDEIRAVEALQKQNPTFTYGSILSTEAFMKEDGEIGGFSSLFCEWLTQLFGIQFIPALYPRLELVERLKNGEVDFTGEITPALEHSGTYLMTDAIAERTVKTIRIENSESFLEIAAKRPFRLAFVDGTFAADTVISTFEYGSFEVVFVNDGEHAYHVLKSGNVDAFFCIGGTEISFILNDDVVVSDYFPLIYEPVSLSAQNSAFEPIITVVQKALQNGAFTYLAEMYNRGQTEYLRHTLFSRLTADERAYIHNNPKIPYVTQYRNYPTSFYDLHEEKWQGIAFQLLDEIEVLTGISFELAHGNELINWPDLLEMVESGQAAFVTELVRTKAWKGRFFWLDTTLATEYCTLISRTDQRNFRLTEVKNLTVGVIRNTAQTEAFMRWFPNHRGIVEFDGIREAVDALDREELDLVMSGTGNLLTLTNYQELTGYKANIVFNNDIQESTFGFNRGEVILCSIINKTLKFIDTEKISNDWKSRIFDYRYNLIEAQRPWLIGAIILLSFIFVLLFILFQYSRYKGKRMKNTLEYVAAGQTDHAESVFLENTNHELRTPTNSVGDYTGKIQTNAEWLLHIINDKLAVSKVESGKMEFEHIPFDIHELFAGCRTLIMPIAAEKGIKLHFEAEPAGKIPLGDPARLRQVFFNLLSNAVKFTNTGAIKFHAKITDTGEKTVTMYFKIKDSGIGMTSEQIDRIFDPQNGGTGLGLAITKNIIELMGGKLSVESMIGVGSNFSFTLTFDTMDIPVIAGEVPPREDNLAPGSEELIRQESPGRL